MLADMAISYISSAMSLARVRSTIQALMLGSLLGSNMIIGRGVAFSSPVGGPFKSPYGIAIDGRGNIYVGDADLDRILTFSPSGHVLARFGRFSGGLLGGPGAMAVYARGNVFVTDTGYNRVEEYAPSGRLITQWGRSGKKPGQFESPNGLAVDSHGDVYVADDVHAGRIQKFSANGRLLAVVAKGIESPLGIALTPSGDIDVVSWGADHVVRLSPSGRKLGQFGSSGHRPGQFNGPAFLAIDRRGTTYVNDRENGRIEAFSATGRFLRIVASKGSGRGQLGTPEGVAVNAQGDLYVADETHKDVAKFSPTGKLLATF
jgi:DNA-binding beta-propeller fold protein YncE